MRDHLLDIVKHTHSLGTIGLVKITGTESLTTIDAVSEERICIMNAQFHNPVPEFIGTFGMPNLAKLNTILNIPEYKEDAKITINTKSDADDPSIKVPESIHFENKVGDFKNDYRLMSSMVINDQLKTVKFKGARWGVEIEPTAASIMRMKFQASANSEQTHFIAKTENGNLVFYFGDHSSHAGNFVFAHDVAGSVTKAWSWPISSVIGVLSLAGNKMIRFSDDGAAQITVDSGLALYNYTFPART
jgi:hypothetical protein